MSQTCKKSKISLIKGQLLCLNLNIWFDSAVLLMLWYSFSLKFGKLYVVINILLKISQKEAGAQNGKTSSRSLKKGGALLLLLHI